MHKLRNGSQVTVRPTRKQVIGTPGYFSESNDEGAPSIPGQDWFNDCTDEFLNALAAMGITYDPTRLDHLARALSTVESNFLQTRVGQRAEIHSATIPDWLLKADGSTGVSRTVDDVLWAHAENSGLLVSQALKDADPVQYAMYYGDGDGSTTFSLPNWYLGHFPRGNPSGVALGETQASQNLTHSHPLSSDTYNVAPGGGATVLTAAGSGANTGSSGGSEARPKTGNINICIERGKIPA